MAGRSDAATDRCSRSTAPSLATYSMCAWAKINATHAGNLFHPILRLSDAGDASAWIVGFKGTNGRTPSVYSPSNAGGINAAEQALSTWVFIGATLSGTAAQLFYGTTPGSLTKVTGTVAAPVTPTQFGVFGRSAADGSEWLEGDLYGLRQWSGGTILSDAEMAAESQLAPSVSTPAARTTNLWHSIPFTAAALTDVSGNTRPLAAGSTALASATDPALGPIAGALSIGTTAAVSLGAFADRPRSLAIGTTAAVVLSPVRQTAGALSIAATAAVTTSPVLERAAALSVAATAGVALSPERVTSAALSVGSVAAVGLSPVRTTLAALSVTAVAAVDLQPDRTTSGALAITATSQLALVPLADRTAALDATSTAEVTLSAFRSTAAALNASAAVQVSLAPVPERAAALAIGSQAAVVLFPGGQVPAALAVAATAQLALTAARTTPAALDVATAAAVALTSALERPAALAVVAQALLDLDPAGELTAALLIGAVARVLALQDAAVPGSLRLQAGLAHDLRWLTAGTPTAMAVVETGQPGPVSWLSSGPGSPA